MSCELRRAPRLQRRRVAAGASRQLPTSPALKRELKRAAGHENMPTHIYIQGGDDQRNGSAGEATV